MTDLQAAITRAYHAWIRTQPQLILDLWDEAGLDEPQGGDVLRLVEPDAPSEGSIAATATPSWVRADGARAVGRTIPPPDWSLKDDSSVVRDVGVLARVPRRVRDPRGARGQRMGAPQADPPDARAPVAPRLP